MVFQKEKSDSIPRSSKVIFLLWSVTSHKHVEILFNQILCVNC